MHICIQLRDIFRIHPDTGCNTHDLLQCPCGIENDIEGSEDNDVDDAVASDSDLDGEFDIQRPKGFTAASQIQPEQVNKMDKAVRLPVFLCFPKRGSAD